MNPPSFSSFPPSFDSFPDLEQNKRTDTKQDHKPARSQSGKDRDRERKRDKDRYDKRHRSGDNKKVSGRHKDKHGKNFHSVTLDDERTKQREDHHSRLNATYDGGTPGLFVVDKVGDPMNVFYDGLHAGDVPKYRRVGFGNILGLGQAFKIVTKGTGGRSLEVGINGRRPSARYTDSRSFALLTTTKTRQLLPAAINGKPNTAHEAHVITQADFIHLSSRCRHHTEEPLSTYRSIQPTLDVNSDSDSGILSAEGSDHSESLSESDAAHTIPRTAHQHAMEKLEATLQQDPTSLSTWFSLLNETLSAVPPSTKSSLARARADIKLAVLDRAIRTHSRNKASVELRIRWLRVGAEVWDIEKLEREWEAAVTELGVRRGDGEMGLNNRIWEEWLQWRASSAGRGMRRRAGIEGIVEDTMRVLGEIDGELAKVKVLWLISVLLKGAGFSERAIAVFQAQVELTFNCPASLAVQPLNERLNKFEQFWDAEVPRVGEPDAQGWDMWERDGRPVTSTPGPAIDAPFSSQMDVDAAADPYTRWAADENQAESSSRMSKRTDNGDDPYATILFSDVRSLLVDITSPEAKQALRIAWLAFMGLHVPGFFASLSESYSTDNRDDVWSCTHLSRLAFLQQLFPPRGKGKEKEWDVYAGTVVAREKSYGSPFGCVKEWGFGIFGPLEGVKDGEGRMWETADVQGVDEVAVRRIFHQLRRKIIRPGGHEDDDWDIMAIAFEAAISVKGALKLSRSVLSTERDSFSLWAAHARLERLRGKLDEARRIYEAALSSAGADSRTGTLWLDWAEMEWLSGMDENARTVILRAAGVIPTAHSSMSVLRARRGLDDRVRALESSGEWKEWESWVCLWALLEMLTGGTDAIQTAMAAFEGYLHDSGLEGVPKESARVRMLLMAWKHANVLRRPSKRSDIRDKLLKMVQEDEASGGGADTVVLGVFLDVEKGESVWGRLRALVGEGAGDTSQSKELLFGRREKSVTRRIWEVWLATWEKGRWETEQERLRNSLGIGVEEDRTRASPILWRVFVEFEIYSGKLQRAKALLFRAVSECPLVKELYLLAFGPLRSAFTPRELEGWAETMAERGIRLHRDVEVYVGSDVKAGESTSEGESGGEAELEKAAEDYRRLVPF